MQLINLIESLGTEYTRGRARCYQIKYKVVMLVLCSCPRNTALYGGNHWQELIWSESDISIFGYNRSIKYCSQIRSLGFQSCNKDWNVIWSQPNWFQRGNKKFLSCLHYYQFWRYDQYMVVNSKQIKSQMKFHSETNESYAESGFAY